VPFFKGPQFHYLSLKLYESFAVNFGLRLLQIAQDFVEVFLDLLLASIPFAGYASKALLRSLYKVLKLCTDIF
jgi:hypothetical protein